MDRAVEMSVEAFCMAVGANGSLLNQYVDEKWSVYLFAHYPEFADGGWQIRRGQLLVEGETEHPALYTRKSLNKMFGTKNIKLFFDYYRSQWDAYRLWQDEQIEADEIEASNRESLEDDGDNPIIVTDDEWEECVLPVGIKELLDEEDVVCMGAVDDSDIEYTPEDVDKEVRRIMNAKESIKDGLQKMRVVLRDKGTGAGIPTSDPYYGSPNGPYNQ